MNRPRPVPPFAAGEERLEDALGVRRRDARAAIQHLEERPVRGGDAAGAHLDWRHRRRRAAVLQRVLAQIPQQLVQVRGIDAHVEVVRRRSSMRIALLVDLARSGGTPPGNPRSQPLSSMRSGRVESRRDSCSTLLMMVLTRSPLLVMMSVRRRSCGRQRGDSRQQLRRVAHRADRIADLVRDAGAEPAERGELRLLDALGDQRRVLEEDQRRALAAAVERDEVRLHQAAAVGGEHASACSAASRTSAGATCPAGTAGAARLRRAACPAATGSRLAAAARPIR